MTDIGTYQVEIPVTIAYPEPQFRTDARSLFDELRAKFLAGIAAIDWAGLYDRYAEVARQKYNEIDPETKRPPIAKGGVLVAMPIRAKRAAPKRPARKATKKKAAKPAAKRKRK